MKDIIYKHQNHAKFYTNPPEQQDTDPVRLPASYLMTLLKNGITLIRAVSDVAIRKYLPYLEGPGTIYELGGATDYYKKFVPATQSYIVTDFNPKIEHNIDMTKMPFADNSIDAFISIFSLEHIREYYKGIIEVKRTLKPGGRFLLVVPFMYCYHAAPDDFVRFSKSYIASMFDDWKQHALVNIGSRGLMVAEMYHEKPFMRQKSGSISKSLRRWFAALWVLNYILNPKIDNTFPSAILTLVEKPIL